MGSAELHVCSLLQNSGYACGGLKVIVSARPAPRARAVRQRLSLSARAASYVTRGSASIGQWLESEKSCVVARHTKMLLHVCKNWGSRGSHELQSGRRVNSHDRCAADARGAAPRDAMTHRDTDTMLRGVPLPACPCAPRPRARCCGFFRLQ